MAKATIEVGRSYSIKTRAGEQITGTLVAVLVSSRGEVNLLFGGLDFKVTAKAIVSIQPSAVLEIEIA